VFDWHARPGALARLTPPWQPVRPEREATSLRDGRAVLRLPAGRRWVAQHLAEEYVPGRSFADSLISRPFVVPVHWHHRHEFETRDDGTVLTDRIATPVPDVLLRRLFAYRQRQLADDLTAHRWAAGRPRLTVAVTGASGLIGSALAPLLTTGGHRVIRLVRRMPVAPDERYWDPLQPDPAVLSGVDAVVHLAGANIAGRFTDGHKQAIRTSRVEPTRRLVQAAATASVPVFVSASAIGIYGSARGDEVLDEHSPAGQGFLADLVSDWEQAALAGAAQTPDMRLVLIRTGIVQSPRGGALRLQLPLFATGMGGPVGAGDHWTSWIGIDDTADIFLRALLDERLRGPVNAVAPHPVRQRDYAKALGNALHRPVVLRTPRFAPGLLLGDEGAKEIALASQRVVPRALLEVGHQFRFETLRPALGHLLGKEVR
jgi:hypothetical protein